jgi:hypothetical protein
MFMMLSNKYEESLTKKGQKLGEIILHIRIEFDSISNPFISTNLHHYIMHLENAKFSRSPHDPHSSEREYIILASNHVEDPVTDMVPAHKLKIDYLTLDRSWERSCTLQS